MEKWVGRTALVTGASVGIGAAISKSLSDIGMKVIGIARRVEKIEELSRKLKESGSKGSLTAYKCDVTNDEEVYDLFRNIKKEFGGIDVCINNAGMSHNHSLLDGTPEEWRRMLDVNVVALCLFTKEVIASMRERHVDDGHIVHISSMSGHRVTTSANTHFYASTKHAVHALTEGLRQELRELKSHIRVSEICPGLVETEFALVMNKDPEKTNKMYNSIKCLKAEDIAASVIHVLSAPPHVEINDICIRPTEQFA